MNSNVITNETGAVPERARHLRRSRAWRGVLALLGLAILALPVAVGFAEPSPKPPRPAMNGGVGQGAAPCSATPSDLASMQVVLVRDDGDGICSAGDGDVMTSVGPDGSGNYAFPAATGEPGWQGQPGYCVRVERASLATPDPYGVVEPGTDDRGTVYLDDICVP